MTIFEIDPLRDPRWKILIERHPGLRVFLQIWPTVSTKDAGIILKSGPF
jgi:hypothetical protein